jgi:hypothetical protein
MRRAGAASVKRCGFCMEFFATLLRQRLLKVWAIPQARLVHQFVAVVAR